MNLGDFAVFQALLLCLTTPVLAQPTVQSVVNAASRGGALAPGTWAIIAGAGLAPGEASADSAATSLNGVSVMVGGVPAPMLHVAPDQINALIPFEAASPRLGEQVTLPIVVTTPDGASVQFDVKLSRVAPGIFTKSGDGMGDALAWDADGDPISGVGDGQITLWATGLGPAGDGSRLIDPVFASVGDVFANATFA